MLFEERERERERERQRERQRETEREGGEGVTHRMLELEIGRRELYERRSC